MQKLIIILVLCLFSGFANAQDRIINYKGEELPCRIISIDSSYVKYQLPGSDTSTYEINRSLVNKIYHSSGITDHFSGTDIRRTYQKPYKYHNNYLKNMFHIDLGGLIFARKMSLGVERIVSSGKIGLKIPVEVGLTEQVSEYSTYSNWRYSIGADANYYPGGQGRFRYYLGPGIRIGRIIGKYYDESRIGINESNAEYYTTGAFALLLNNGVLIQLSRTFNIGGHLSLGAISYDKTWHDKYNPGNIRTRPEQDLMYDVQVNFIVRL